MPTFRESQIWSSRAINCQTCSSAKHLSICTHLPFISNWYHPKEPPSLTTFCFLLSGLADEAAALYCSKRFPKVHINYIHSFIPSRPFLLSVKPTLNQILTFNTLPSPVSLFLAFSSIAKVKFTQLEVTGRLLILDDGSDSPQLRFQEPLLYKCYFCLLSYPKAFLNVCVKSFPLSFATSF